MESIPTRITTRWLNRIGVCSGAADEFRKIYGGGTDINPEALAIYAGELSNTFEEVGDEMYLSVEWLIEEFFNDEEQGIWCNLCRKAKGRYDATVLHSKTEVVAFRNKCVAEAEAFLAMYLALTEPY